MSFFSEKSVLQCGLHKMTTLLASAPMHGTVHSSEKKNSHPVMDFQVLSSQ